MSALLGATTALAEEKGLPQKRSPYSVEETAEEVAFYAKLLEELTDQAVREHGTAIH
ncbi:MAG: hypothetical protein AAGA96_08490 [Verrucomicrobiota bacterium]